MGHLPIAVNPLVDVHFHLSVGLHQSRGSATKVRTARVAAFVCTFLAEFCWRDTLLILRFIYPLNPPCAFVCGFARCPSWATFVLIFRNRITTFAWIIVAAGWLGNRLAKFVCGLAGSAISWIL